MKSPFSSGTPSRRKMACASVRSWRCLGIHYRANAICSAELDCTYGDAGYIKGDTFPAAGGCGTCQCDTPKGSSEPAKVTCDLTACEERDAGTPDADANDGS